MIMNDKGQVRGNWEPGVDKEEGSGESGGEGEEEELRNIYRSNKTIYNNVQKQNESRLPEVSRLHFINPRRLVLSLISSISSVLNPVAISSITRNV